VKGGGWGGLWMRVVDCSIAVEVSFFSWMSFSSLNWVISVSFSEYVGACARDAVDVDRLLLMTIKHIPSNANARSKYGAPMAAWAYGSERTGMATVRVYEQEEDIYGRPD